MTSWTIFVLFKKSKEYENLFITNLQCVKNDIYYTLLIKYKLLSIYPW